ncbi:hypothetical protein D3C80_1012530 [compost metagenome]
MRRLKRRKPLFDISLNVFHHHDSVIHDDTDSQYQPEQTQGIERKAKQVENAERSHDRYRHRDQRNNRRAPGLQKQNHHQYNQRHRFQQGLHDRVNGVAYENRRIVRRRPLHIFRETRGQFVHFRPHGVRQIDGVRARGLEDTNPDRVFIVELRTQRIAARTHFNPCHIAQAYQRAVLCRFQNNIAKLFFCVQTPLGINGDQEIALFRQRLSAKLPGGNLYVLLLHRRHHIGGRQPARRDFSGIKPDAHRVFAGAKNLNLTHARQTRQLILHF